MKEIEIRNEHLLLFSKFVGITSNILTYMSHLFTCSFHTVRIEMIKKKKSTTSRENFYVANCCDDTCTHRHIFERTYNQFINAETRERKRICHTNIEQLKQEFKKRHTHNEQNQVNEKKIAAHAHNTLTISSNNSYSDFLAK